MISKRYDHLIRLLLVGETGVGKTCLLCRFTSGDYVESHISTIGIDFKMKTIELEGQTVKVQIWDTAGQERFEAITKQFYRRAQGVMLVFDICNKSSFEAMPRWLNYVKQFSTDRVSVTLIGNKSDCHDKRQVSVVEAQQFADKNEINFYEVSARDRNNLEKPFLDMCREVLHHVLEHGEPEQVTSILMEPAAGDVGTNLKQGTSPATDPNLAAANQNQGNWCCTVS